MKNKIKIGDVEFALPFKQRYDEYHVEDANGKVIVSCCCEFFIEASAKTSAQLTQTIATALNEHFARQWVSVKDGLPEKSGKYLVTWRDFGSGEIGASEAYFDGNNWFHYEGDSGVAEDVIAWQDARLPEPFEEKE